METLPSARRITTPTELAFSVMFGIPPVLAALLSAMFDGATVCALRCNIARLRGALTVEAIDTGEMGYHLTDVGLSECNEALADFRRWVIEERAA